MPDSNSGRAGARRTGTLRHTTVQCELVAYDVPQRLAISGIYEFPVGPKKKWLNHGIASHIIGGWAFDWTGIAQPGQPITYSGSYYIYGDPRLASGQDLNHWFSTSEGRTLAIAAPVPAVHHHQPAVFERRLPHVSLAPGDRQQAPVARHAIPAGIHLGQGSG